MQHAEVEVLLGRQVPYTGEECLPQRPIIGPFGKDFVDGRVVDGRLALCIVRYRQALPRHPRVEHPQNEVKDAMITQFALWPTLGHREVGEDKCRELGFGELDRNRRRCRLGCRYAHHARASCEEYGCARWNHITSYTTIG